MLPDPKKKGETVKFRVNFGDKYLDMEWSRQSFDAMVERTKELRLSIDEYFIRLAVEDLRTKYGDSLEPEEDDE